MEVLLQPWPWYVAGPGIALVMLLLLYFGGNFGMSSNFRTVCSIVGGDKACDFFNFDWKGQKWNLVFALGAISGGFLAANYLSTGEAVLLSEGTVAALGELGFQNPGGSYLPNELFGMEALFSIKGILLLVGGGFLVGFGARYAGGCTSGHAISGLSDLQLPSLIAVVGFFIGGLAMTHLFLPLIF